MVANTPARFTTRDAERFAVRLGAALQRYGAPAHRVEGALTGVAQALGIDGQFFCEPTALMVSFGGDDDAPRHHLVRSGPAGVDLARLAAVDVVAQQVARRQLTPAGGLRQLDAITRSPRPRWAAPAEVVATGVVGAGAAVLFGGGWAEVAAAGLAGTAAGGAVVVASRVEAGVRLAEVLAVLAAATVAALAQQVMGQLAGPLVVLAAIIVFLPGFSLTVAVTELATDNLVAGGARLTAAAMVLLKLAFGGVLAARLLGSDAMNALVPAMTPVPQWALPLAVVATGPALAVLFRDSAVQAPWVTAAAALGYGSARAVSELAHAPELAAFVAALCVTVASHGVARWLDRPVTVTLVPGIMMLVPGSIGFSGVASLLRQDVLAGVDGLFAAALVAVSIAAGILTAHVIVEPRRAL